MTYRPWVETSLSQVRGNRDTCRLLLDFASRQARKRPCQLDISDLDAR